MFWAHPVTQEVIHSIQYNVILWVLLETFCYLSRDLDMKFKSLCKKFTTPRECSHSTRAFCGQHSHMEFSTFAGMCPPTLCWGVSPYFFIVLTPSYPSESSKFPLTRNLPDHSSSFLHPYMLPFLKMHSQHHCNSCLPTYSNDDVIRDGSILIFPSSPLS